MFFQLSFWYILLLQAMKPVLMTALSLLQKYDAILLGKEFKWVFTYLHVKETKLFLTSTSEPQSPMKKYIDIIYIYTYINIRNEEI